MPLKEFTPIHAVKHVQSQAVHHMNILVLLRSGLDRPNGLYDCAPLYRDYPKLMDEIVLYGNQTATGDVLLPPGVAAEVPPGLTYMYELHFVNATSHDIQLSSRVNAYTMDPAQVSNTIWGGPVRDVNLDLPPMQEHTEWTRCAMTRDVDVIFLSSHTHRLGKDVTIYRWDGQQTGDLVFRNTDWLSPALTAFDRMPLHVPKGTGFEFRCHYYNDQDHPVHYGLTAQDEMCTMVVVFTPGDPTTTCMPLQTSDGVLGP
jgi:hypothetical protein